jgi:hypothetical protein
MSGGYPTTSMTRLRLLIAVFALSALGLTSAAPAQGAADHADFVRQVDPVCKRERVKARSLLNHAKPRNRSRAKAYARIARRGRAAIQFIYHVGPAPQSTELVLFDRWIQKLQLENALIDQTADALRSGRTKRAAKLLADAADADRRAAHIVRGYKFRYCDRPALGSP